MEPSFDPAEVRVLGCLLEKEITTPEYYPMTVNALVNACNQKNNRDPVVNFSDSEVDGALQRLRVKGFASTLTGGGNRVPKHSHRIHERLNLGRRELAILCELMLRSPQTLGELNSRAERMHRFGDLDEVEACVNGLMARGLVDRYPVAPGRKEPRFAHMLSGPLRETAPAETRSINAGSDRLTLLESEVASLKGRLASIESEWASFRKQFE